MKLNQRKLRKMILSEIKRIIKEERDAPAIQAYFEELREKTKANPDLSPEERKELKDRYNIHTVKTLEDGRKSAIFLTEPVIATVLADSEEGEEKEA